MKKYILAFAVLLIMGTFSYAQTPKKWIWDANTESDLAGYKVYNCPSSPCTKANGTLLGSTTQTEFPIPDGTSAYAFITAYDQSGNESSESNVVFTDSKVPNPPAALRIN
jgi:hypothetical protein